MRSRVRAPRPLATEDGFTLVELLVSMTLAIVVLIAILGASDLFRTTSKAATELSVVQDTGRTTLREMTDTLRQAVQASGTTPVQATRDRNDLTVAAYVRNTAGTLQRGWVRYCTSSDGRSLLRGTRIAATWSDPGACARNTATDPAAGWVYGTVVAGALHGATKLFAYSSADCYGACVLAPAAIRTVGIRLEIATGDGSRTTILRGAVSLRNRPENPS